MKNKQFNESLAKKADKLKIKAKKAKPGAKPTKKIIKDMCNALLQDGIILTPDKFKRDIVSETQAVTTGTSSALSSKQVLYYHDIPPELIRRVGKRHTVGHKKYNDNPVPTTMNLNWRIGLDDPFYVLDRMNHIIEHWLDFQENGNELDDNLAAMVWGIGFLMEVERLHPDIFKLLYGQHKLSGKQAEEYKQKLNSTMLLIDKKRLQKQYPGFEKFARESRGLDES